ncbi:uncharacterized protein Bfra_000064 [Botrytis fragariae]|uniref:Uncharacterized protein n=1 Tax=Botrytis fragariae TaxID=1964551 RepID=A0A8H6B1W7_9HELO|nr:uncharacterized protein Bfra_000064 [Botrytis fragariae]KAF5877901.1 hypothetical protein Bfra_000064 [Botrytis fragariae]
MAYLRRSFTILIETSNFSTSNSNRTKLTMSETQTVSVKKPFVPKQMMAKTATLYKELTSDS